MCGKDFYNRIYSDSQNLSLMSPITFRRSTENKTIQ